MCSCVDIQCKTGKIPISFDQITNLLMLRIISQIIEFIAVGRRKYIIIILIILVI